MGRAWTCRPPEVQEPPRALRKPACPGYALAPNDLPASRPRPSSGERPARSAPRPWRLTEKEAEYELAAMNAGKRTRRAPTRRRRQARRPRVPEAPQGLGPPAGHARPRPDKLKPLLDEWGDRPMAEWSRPMLEALLHDRAWSTSRVRQALGVYRRFIAWCRAVGYVCGDFVGEFKPPRARPQEHREALSAEQCRRLLDEAKGHYLEVPVALALLTGLSRADLRAITWKEVDLDAGLITRPRSQDWPPPPPPHVRAAARGPGAPPPALGPRLPRPPEVGFIALQGAPPAHGPGRGPSERLAPASPQRRHAARGSGDRRRHDRADARAPPWVANHAAVPSHRRRPAAGGSGRRRGGCPEGAGIAFAAAAADPPERGGLRMMNALGVPAPRDTEDIAELGDPSGGSSCGPAEKEQSRQACLPRRAPASLLTRQTIRPVCITGTRLEESPCPD